MKKYGIPYQIGGVTAPPPQSWSFAMYEWILLIAINTGNGGIDQKLITGFETYELCMKAAGKIYDSAAENLRDAGVDGDADGVTFNCQRLEKRR